VLKSGTQKGYSRKGTQKGTQKRVRQKALLKKGTQKGVLNNRVLKTRDYKRVTHEYSLDKLLRVRAAVIAGYWRAVRALWGTTEQWPVWYGRIYRVLTACSHDGCPHRRLRLAAAVPHSCAPALRARCDGNVLTRYSRGTHGVLTRAVDRTVRCATPPGRGPTARSAAHVCGTTACALRWVSGIARRGTWLAMLAGYSTGTPGPSTACTEAHPSASTAAAVWSQ
jgi:hypothetical protein